MPTSMKSQSVQGLPLDAESIAAGIVADAVHTGELSIELAGERLGPICVLLIQDMLKVRTLPSRCDVYDDVASATVRELCLNFYDARSALGSHSECDTAELLLDLTPGSCLCLSHSTS